MNIKVQYYSKSGNTKKIADAIAQTVGTKSQQVTEVVDFNETIDLLFIGGSIYAGHIDSTLKHYIESLSNKVKKVSIFSTSAGKNSAYHEMKELFEAKHIQVDPDEFYCKGKFLMAHRKRPDENDIELSKKFAQSVINKLK